MNISGISHSHRNDPQENKEFRKILCNCYRFNLRESHKNVDCNANKTNPSDNDSNTEPESVVNLLKEEFLRFCHNTTIRGISKIVKARSKKIQFMWIIFEIILFVGLLVCMLLLAKQYFEYNVLHPPQVKWNVKSPFPAITVCNLRPISPNGRRTIEKNNWKAPRTFASSVNVNAANEYFWNKNLETRKKYSQMTSAISMGGYLESIPNHQYRYLGHFKNNFVIYCEVQYLEGIKSESKHCSEVGNWTYVVHALYLNCHTFTLAKSYRESVRSLEMYLFLDEDTRQFNCVDCFLSELKSQLSGALIVMHSSETLPDINQHSTNLQPGTLTEFKLKIVKKKNKSPPFGKCSADLPHSYRMANGTVYEYSQTLCVARKMQQDVNRQCNCSAIEFPLLRMDLPFCSQLPHFLASEACSLTAPQLTAADNATHDRMRTRSEYEADRRRCIDDMEAVLVRNTCKNNVTRYYKNDMNENCSLPCMYYSYESDRSISAWPTKSMHLAWIQSKKAKRLSSREEIATIKNMTNASEAWMELQKQNILERNLLAILINRPNQNLQIVEEKEVLSLTNFLSQSGGLLSIWIGITMISFVEVAELVIHCIEVVKWKYSKSVGSVNRAQNAPKHLRSKNAKQHDNENHHHHPHECFQQRHCHYHHGNISVMGEHAGQHNYAISSPIHSHYSQQQQQLQQKCHQFTFDSPSTVSFGSALIPSMNHAMSCDMYSQSQTDSIRRKSSTYQNRRFPFKLLRSGNFMLAINRNEEFKLRKRKTSKKSDVN